MRMLGSRFHIWAILLCSLLVLLPFKPACAAATVAAAPVTTANTDAAIESTGSDYKLGVNDKVRVLVYNEVDLSGEFEVNAAGNLSLPLAGDVKAEGRTPGEVTQDIQARLAAGYLKDPRVSLDVLTYRPFYILGEVTKPGEYPYSNGLTVINAVARAEGFTYRANKRKVFIKRAGTGAEQEFVMAPGLQIQPGDTIRIGERYF